MAGVSGEKLEQLCCCDSRMQQSEKSHQISRALSGKSDVVLENQKPVNNTVIFLVH